MNKHLIIISVGRLSQMIIMFLTYRVLSTVLSVPDMGIYYFLLSISAAFGLVYANPIGMYANRMLHNWQDHGVMIRNLKTIMISLFIGSLLTIPFLFIFKDKISFDNHNWFFLVGVLIFYVFSTTFNGTLVPSLNLLGFTNQFVIWTLATNSFGLMLSYLLVTFISNDPLYWLIGQAISFALCGLFAYGILLTKIKDKVEQIKVINTQDRINRVAKFAFPIVITNLAVWILGQSFRFFYKENIDLSVLGELAFGLGLATSLSVAVEYLFQQLYFPDFYRKINSTSTNKGEVWNHLLNKLIAPYIYFTAFLIGLSPFILRVLADVKFKNSVEFLALGACVELLRMTSNVFTMATQSEMKTYKAIGPYLIGGILTLFGVIYISHNPQYVSHTPIVLMIGYVSTLVLLINSVGKILKIELNVIKLLKICIISLVFISGLLFYKYSDNLVISILINTIYGLFFIFLLYRNYIQSKKLEEV
jgi:O-antigen/teichoic acid export membrane protein